MNKRLLKKRNFWHFKIKTEYDVCILPCIFHFQSKDELYWFVDKADEVNISLVDEIMKAIKDNLQIIESKKKDHITTIDTSRIVADHFIFDYMVSPLEKYSYDILNIDDSKDDIQILKKVDFTLTIWLSKLEEDKAK